MIHDSGVQGTKQRQAKDYEKTHFGAVRLFGHLFGDGRRRSGGAVDAGINDRSGSSACRWRGKFIDARYVAEWPIHSVREFGAESGIGDEWIANSRDDAGISECLFAGSHGCEFQRESDSIPATL